MPKLHVIIFSSVLFLLAACGNSPQAISTLAPNPTYTPLPTYTPFPEFSCPDPVQQALEDGAPDSIEARTVVRVTSEMMPAVVVIRGEETEGGNVIESGHSTGFIVSPDGLIATAAHNLEGLSTFEAYLFNEMESQEMPLEIIAIHDELDIALVKIEGEDLPYLQFGDSGALKNGDQLIAMGHPGWLRWITTSGTFIVEKADAIGEIYLFADLPLSEGSSGGPVLNSDGEVVGLVSGNSGGESYDHYLQTSPSVYGDLCSSTDPGIELFVPGNLVKELVFNYLQ